MPTWPKWKKASEGRALVRVVEAEISNRTVVSPLDKMVNGWLKDCYSRTKSERTYDAYQKTMRQFRAYLHAQMPPLDLDSDPARIAYVTECWARQSFPRDGSLPPLPAEAYQPDADDLEEEAKPVMDVSNATYNLRITTLSSFYRYWQKKIQERTIPNPMQRVTRHPVQEFANARALTEQQLTDFRAIDRSTPQGLRDYALLLVALTTGRRAFELAGLCKETVNKREVIEANSVGGMTLYFKRCKGGGKLDDQLLPEAAAAVYGWIARYYGDLARMPKGAPLWPALAPHGRGGAMSTRNISYLCKKYLGSGKVHATRHTFARKMEDSGARISEIAAKLGQKNPTVTGRYLVALHSAENPHADKLAEALGLR